MNTNDLLIEIGCEEIPPKALQKLSQCLAERVSSELEKQGFAFKTVIPYASPRRLALIISELVNETEAKVIAKRGPAVTAAFNETGKPTKAALGFAKSCGVEIDVLDTIENEKGKWLYYEEQQPGATLQTVLPDIIKQALGKLPIPKPMRWGDAPYEFVRPVHWFVCLYGDSVIPAEVMGKKSGRTTYGHRFHAPSAVTIKSPDEYINLLRDEGHVIACFNTRKEMIRDALMEVASAKQATVVIDDALLDEVTALVEWPSALVIEFDEALLAVPPEALISAIKNHQKCFHLVGQDEKLLPMCITISNIESIDPLQVIYGNQKVIRARLKDAEFFYQQDCEQSLDTWLAQSKTVIFQHKLGSLFDKMTRLQNLIKHLATTIACNEKVALRAAALAKADLQSDMVGEFPELQGIMGYYYCLNAQEEKSVALAVREHYWPRFSKDNLPTTPEAVSVALADRFDTLVGIFGIGEKPTGEKDPYGLRRAAIGIVRMLVEFPVTLSLEKTILAAYDGYAEALSSTECLDEVRDYIIERMVQWLKDSGVNESHIQAALAVQNDNLYDCTRRIQAIAEFATLPEAEALIAGNKRVRNILSKTDIDISALDLDHHSLSHETSLLLAGDIDEKQSIVAPLIQKAQYKEALFALASLRERVDEFFENVMVMDEDIAKRNNNLALLYHLQKLFNRIADISVIR